MNAVDEDRANPMRQKLMDWRVILVGVFTVLATTATYLLLSFADGDGGDIATVLWISLVYAAITIAVGVIPSLVVWIALRAIFRRVTSLSDLWIDRLVCGLIAALGGLFVTSALFVGLSSAREVWFAICLIPMAWAVLGVGLFLHPKSKRL